VTDEQGGGEPLVILPLDEYEALIDGAMGPDDEGNELAPWDLDEEEEEIESIQLPDEEMVEEALENVDEKKGEEIKGTPDEAEVDEEALKELWKEPEVTISSKTTENSKEVPKKNPGKSGVGEEQFYLEPLD
jgi:hypothetical protein